MTDIPEVEALETPSVAETVPPAEEPVAPAEEPKQAERTYTEAELQERIQARTAKVQRQFDRELRARLEQENAYLRNQGQPQPKAAEGPAKPEREKFANDVDYIEAIADYKAEQKINERFQSQRQESAQEAAKREFTSAVQAHTQREAAFKAAHPEYDEKVTDDLPISKPMAETILQSEKGPEITLYLANNPEESARISKLSYALAAKEIGKIEAKIEAKTLKISNAPAPMKPVPTAQALAKDLASMSQEDFEKHMAKNGSRMIRAR